VRTQSHRRTVDYSLMPWPGNFPMGVRCRAAGTPPMGAQRPPLSGGAKSHEYYGGRCGPITRLTVASLQTGSRLQAQLQGSSLDDTSATLAAYRVREKCFTEPFIALLRYGQWPLQTSEHQALVRDKPTVRAGRVECAPNPFGARLLPMSPEKKWIPIARLGPSGSGRGDRI
jgi:hypothetical protein